MMILIISSTAVSGRPLTRLDHHSPGDTRTAHNATIEIFIIYPFCFVRNRNGTGALQSRRPIFPFRRHVW